MRGVVLKLGGRVVENMWTTPLTTPIFCMYDNDGLFKPAYMKVLIEGERMYRAVAFFFYWQKCTFHFFSFRKCVIMNLSSLKVVRRRGAEPSFTAPLRHTQERARFPLGTQFRLRRLRLASQTVVLTGKYYRPITIPSGPRKPLGFSFKLRMIGRLCGVAFV